MFLTDIYKSYSIRNVYDYLIYFQYLLVFSSFLIIECLNDSIIDGSFEMFGRYCDVISNPIMILQMYCY